MKIETREKIRLGHLGKKHSSETKNKIAVSMKQIMNTEEMKLKMRKIAEERLSKMSPEEKEKRYGYEFRKRISDAYETRSGIKRESINNIRFWAHRIRASTDYKKWKQAVFLADNCQCKICRQKNNLEPHHKTSISEIIKENLNKIKSYDLNIPLLWDIKNGETFCNVCHASIIHKKTSFKKTSIALFKNLLQENIRPIMKEQIISILEKAGMRS